ncbi:MAG: hypothetical protein KAX42_08400 [Sphaerotilus sp.]|nr:hypothetical protein [Sphaerotilus sp.]
MHPFAEAPAHEQQVFDTAFVQVQGLVERRRHRQALQRIQPQALFIQQEVRGPRRQLGAAAGTQMRQLIRDQIAHDPLQCPRLAPPSGK